MDESINSFLIRVVKSLFYTFAIVLVSMIGINTIVNLVFKNMSVEQSNTWMILSMEIGIVFTIFFCTFTILNEIKKKG